MYVSTFAWLEILSLSALSIANIRRWVSLNGLVLCMCVYVWPEVTCFSTCLLPPLQTSVCEFTKWSCVVYMCVCLTRSNMFLSLSAPPIANIRRWVSLNGLVLCMFVCLTRSNLFLSLCLLPPLPTPARMWVLLNYLVCCVCVHVWPEVTCFLLSALSIANIS